LKHCNVLTKVETLELKHYNVLTKFFKKSWNIIMF